MTPFRLTAPDPLEVDIHEACARVLDRLLAPPAVWACYPAGGLKLSEAQAARLIRMGLKRAWPDLLILFTAALRGRIEGARPRAFENTRGPDPPRQPPDLDRARGQSSRR